MPTPLETFSACSDENKLAISVINAAMSAAFQTEEGEKECSILDCGTSEGSFVSALVESSPFPCHIFGIDITSDTLEKAKENYRAAGALSAQAAKANIVEQDGDAIRQALGWEYDADDWDPVIPYADVLLASHIGYYINSSEQPETIAKFSQLIDPNGMMVFIHSNGYSEFNDLRAMMGKEINTEDDAMFLTHSELRYKAYRNHLPVFSIELPCSVHLPNDEAALRAAWFGTGMDSLTEEQQQHVALLENIISFAANNTPIEELRGELGDRLEQIWQDYWQPQLEKYHGKEELLLSGAGGKMTFGFREGKAHLAQHVRDAVEDFCKNNGLHLSYITTVNNRPREQGHGFCLG